jgi:hypothetical protein
MKGITKSSTSLNPAIGGNWVGLLKKYLTHEITKEQHTLILLRWELGRTVEKYSNTNNHKRAAHHSIPCFIGGKGGRTVEKIL